jgi:uncharacterized membrane protein YdbT with pleckstrin-like domain
MAASKPDFASLKAWTNELDSLAGQYWQIPISELVLLEGLVSKRERTKSTKRLRGKSDSELLEQFSELFEE